MRPGKPCTKHNSSPLTLGAFNRSGKYRRSECRWCQMAAEKAKRADPKVKEQRRQQAKRRWLRIKEALAAMRSVTQTGDRESSVTQTGQSSVTQTGDRPKSSVTQTGDCQSPRQVTESVTQTGDRTRRPPPVPKRREVVIDLSDLPPIPPEPPMPPPDDDGSFVTDSAAYFARRDAIAARNREIERRRAIALGLQQ